MGSFVRPNELEGLKDQNSRLSVENNELRRMMGLFQENLELRFALKDHETQIRSFPPPAPPSSPSPMEKAKDADRPMPHCMDDVPCTSTFQGKGIQMEERGASYLNDNGERGKMLAKGYKLTDSSLEPRTEKHIEGHRKFLASVSKTPGENKEVGYNFSMERFLPRYK